MDLTAPLIGTTRKILTRKVLNFKIVLKLVLTS